MNAFISPEPHPETLELARKLIDEIQTGGKSCSHSSKLPPVPAFQDSINIRKQSVKKMLVFQTLTQGAEAEDMYKKK